MKKRSIKTQLTFYYGFIMSILVIILVGILFMYSEREIKSRTTNALYHQVHQAIYEIQVKDGTLKFNQDLMKLENGVYLSVYDENKEMLYGRVPYAFECHDGFHMELKTSVQNHITYLVYDFPFFPDGKTKVLIRGVVNLTDAKSSLQHVFLFSLVLFPILIIVSLILGYFLSKRALSPVSIITNKVKQIMEHYQRDERIALGTGKDEIYEMAATFDQLLDEVQTLITREQQFTSDVSHELRTPISVILMQCESLLDQDLTPELQHSIQIIQQKARSMHQMISQLLMLSRADAGRTKLEMEELDLSELCEISAQEQSFIAQAKNIEMKTDITPNIMFHGDMTLLIRLLVNLLSKDITYGKEGGWIELSLHQDEQSTILKVADNGIGIAEEHLPHIFDRFYQVDTSRTSSHSGLGLSMVKWICEVHQGTIQVDSIINEGTTFTLIFPK